MNEQNSTTNQGRNPATMQPPKLRKLRPLKTRRRDPELSAIAKEVKRIISRNCKRLETDNRQKTNSTTEAASNHKPQPKLVDIIRHVRRFPRFKNRFGITGNIRNDRLIDMRIIARINSGTRI